MNKERLIFMKKYIFKDKKYFIMVCLVTLIQSLIITFIPYLTKILLDDVFPNQNYKMFYRFILVMLLCYIVNAGLNVIKDFLLSVLSEKIALRLRTAMNKKISSMRYDYLDKYTLGDILSRYNKEVEVIKKSCGDMLTRTISNIATFLLASIVISLIQWQILFLSIVILSVYVWNNKFWGQKVKCYAEKTMKYNEDSMNIIAENYQNVLISKIYRAYHYINNKFQQAYIKQYKSQIGLEIIYSSNVNISNLLIYLITVFIWLFGGVKVLRGQMTVGKITALLSYQGMLVSPMIFFSELNNSYNSTLIAIDRLKEILDFKDELQEGIDLQMHIDTITFKNVEFGYFNREKILVDANFTLHKGKSVALVGPSGSGKSTFVKLLLKLYQPENGDILINDKNIMVYSAESVRKRITFVAQDSLFFSDTIINNIKLGEEIGDKKIKLLAKKIDMIAEVEGMPEKWETHINIGGSNLSGGQKKRIDIIRALSRESDVMIFDESTASIDCNRRKKLFDLLSEIKSEKIIVFITHNVEEYANFDDIYMIENKTVIKINN